ncbi:transposase InsO family protein [Ancylobacter sp. 3268]|nr:transposase InsO family protein [Ancylobacter sp. 3268]
MDDHWKRLVRDHEQRIDVSELPPFGPDMRSNLRWCSDGLEFACWNREIIRMAFIIDAFDSEIIA